VGAGTCQKYTYGGKKGHRNIPQSILNRAHYNGQKLRKFIYIKVGVHKTQNVIYSGNHHST
jgi:hypothetical protein